MIPLQVFESGALYDPKVLDIKDDDLLAQVSVAVARVAAVSLELNYPTLASIPHSVVNGYKNVLAVAVGTDYSFDLADKVNPCLAFFIHSLPLGTCLGRCPSQSHEHHTSIKGNTTLSQTWNIFYSAKLVTALAVVTRSSITQPGRALSKFPAPEPGQG